MIKIVIATALVGWLGVQSSQGVTIPAGTTLILSTNETVASNEHVGKTFVTRLVHDLVVENRIVLRAGSKFIGRVESSRRLSSGRLVLNVTQLSSHGRLIPIKTVSGFRADDTRFKTRGGISVGSGGFYQLPAGTRLQVRLAQPVALNGGH